MKKRNWNRDRVSTIILILVFLTGLSLLLYPTFSDYWNSLHQSRAIAGYVSDVADIDNDTYEKLWQSAEEYNAALAESGIRWQLTEEEQADYESQLRLSTTDVMGYIEIKKIDCYLPIYHGTDEAVLQVGVGHLEGTSLPVGGESTHCVISGHRGLPSAKLFTDLDQLEVGDTFVLYILDETLTYEVDQIRIVEPDDTSDLEIAEGEDYCTLLTCTPYGVNTHRLLVRGHRTENEKSGARVPADAIQIEPVIVAPLIAVPLLVLLLVGLLVRTRRRTERVPGEKEKTPRKERKARLKRTGKGKTGG